MCNICTTWGYLIGNAMYIVQKLASCFALTAVVTCLIVTMTVMLGVGIGLGYHYCIVQGKTHALDFQDFKDKYDKQTPQRRSNGELPSSVSPRFQQATTDTFLMRATMVVPLDVGVDFPSLISKIRAWNKNITLELLAT